MLLDRHRAARLGIRALEKLQAAGRDQLQFEGSAWNDNTVDFIRAARAHSAFILMQNFAESVSAVCNEVAPSSLITYLDCMPKGLLSASVRPTPLMRIVAMHMVSCEYAYSAYILSGPWTLACQSCFIS